MRTPLRRDHRNNSLPHRYRERGIALVFALFTIAAMLVAITGALITGASNSKAASNYKGAAQVHFVAEAGLSDALQNINATGVIHYTSDVVNGWSSRFGTNVRPFAPLSGYSYSVTTAAGTNAQNTGRLVSTATGPDGVRNVVVANLVRSDKPSVAPGAIYLATDLSTNATFNGDAFLVDGNDHNFTGGAGVGLPVPGITTRNATNTTEAVTSLTTGENDNVKGYGYQVGPPIVPSIATSSSAPTIAQLNQFVIDLEAATGESCKCNTYNNGCINKMENAAACQTGTVSSPKVTWFDSSTSVNGNLDGAGVLIVEGDLNVNGTADYKGLLIVKGKLIVDGNATIYGSVWAEGVNMTVGGSAIVYNSSQALTLANSVVPAGAIMTPMTMTSLADCSDTGPGVGGCPL